MVSDAPFSDDAPDYERLTQLLVGAELAPTPAEAQGMLCGLLALHLPDALERWHAQLLAPPVDAPAMDAREAPIHANGADGASAPLDLTGHGRALAPTKEADGDAEARRAILDQLATWTQSAIAPPSVSFELLLPGEERPLHERANGVLDWVRGLLFGLALGGLERERLQGQAREAFDDLVELTRLDLESVAEDDADEQALTEIVEFLRIAAMLIREETAKTLPNAQARQAHERGLH